MQGKPIVDEKHGHFAQIEGVAMHGRAVLATVEAGPYGEPGNTRDVRTGKVSHKRSPDDALAMTSRLLLYVPPKSEVAVFALESVAGSSGGSRVIEHFHRALGERWGADYWPLERVYEREDWLALSDLKRLTAVYYKWKRDIGSEGGLIPKRKLIGRMEQSLFPELEGGSLPKEIWDAVRAQPLNAAKAMGFELPGEDGAGGDVELVPDALVAQVENDGRKKTIELGHESVPTVRIVISESGKPAPSNRDFVDRCIVECSPLLQASHAISADLKHVQSKWKQDDPTVTWGKVEDAEDGISDGRSVLSGNV